MRLGPLLSPSQSQHLPPLKDRPIPAHQPIPEVTGSADADAALHGTLHANPAGQSQGVGTAARPRGRLQRRVGRRFATWRVPPQLGQLPT